MFELVCVRSRVFACSLASLPSFSAYANARAKVGGGRNGKIRLSRVVASWYSRNIFHVCIMTIN